MGGKTCLVTPDCRLGFVGSLGGIMACRTHILSCTTDGIASSHAGDHEGNENKRDQREEIFHGDRFIGKFTLLVDSG